MTDRLATDRVAADFYDRPVLEVAPDLLGCIVRHGPVALRLTEVEAYDGSNDPGSHAFRGATARTATMFGPPGGLYVYFTYGMHHCANLVCGPAGRASAVLLRAGEVIEGVVEARERRTRPGAAPPVDRDLARGPARLAVTLGLTRDDDGLDTTAATSPLTVHRGEPPAAISSGLRVGVAGEGGTGAYPWRYWVRDDPTVSPYRAAVRRTRSR
ncbi:MAG: DNA-3-methyladenine glycosylase [Mobilicoccus sp.]|nr:DNA-3-methyladenine glycosylase [Mobilicoccus sp.]